MIYIPTCTRPTLGPKPVMILAGLLLSVVQSAKAEPASAPAATTATATNGAAQPAAFDLEMLKSLGLDPKVSDFFSQAPRFTEGTRRVGLTVNGSPRGSVEVLFDAEGQLCFNNALLDQANLIIPDTDFKRAGEVQCYDFLAAYPQTEVQLKPSREEVSLLVSTDALRPFSEDLGVYNSGGVAGLFNYEVLGQNNQFAGGTSSYYSTNTEVGFNAGDWIVRSRQSYSVQNDVSNFQSLYSYAQKTFAPYKSTLQAGQINIGNSVFPGAAITGLQIVPDAALQGKNVGGATVEGIAQGSARVEVRQAGALIHTSLVPAGPFKLPNVQLLNDFTDLDVRVIEDSGEQRSFTVLASSLAQFSMSAPGYSMAAGQVRTFDNKGLQSPMVVTGSGGWLLSPSNKLLTGLMLSDNEYQAAAWTLDSNLTPRTWVSVRNTVASASEEGVKGIEASVSLSTSLTDDISASVNVTRQTNGFRNLLDTTRVQTHDFADSLTRDQYGFSFGWNNDLLGGLTAGYSNSNNFDGRNSRHLTASWGKTFQHATLSLNLERSMGRSRDNHDEDLPGGRRTEENDNAMYFTVSVPLGGKRSARGYVNTQNGATRIGTTYSDNSSDFASYRLSAEHDAEIKEQDFSGNVNLLPRFAQVSLGYSQRGPDSSSYNGQLRGGMAVHGGGVTLSPYPLTDTFGVAKVGDVGGGQTHDTEWTSLD